MEKIQLRNSDLIVSRLCMGGDPMGGYGWGKVSRDELILAVNKALDVGVNFFDTADVYGLGESETILGEALNNRRNDAIIATKFGVRRANDKTYYDNSPLWIKQAVYGSLKRLKTDYIDLYQIHYRDEQTPIEEAIDMLERLKKEGLIRFYGLSNVFQKDYEELLPYKGYFVSFQDEYSLANRTHEEDMKFLSEKLDANPFTWGSLGQGILTGKYDASVKFDANDRRSRSIYKNFHGEKLIKNLTIVDEMRKISKYYNKSLASIAIRFILDYLPNSVVIAGVKSKTQLVSNAEAMDWSLEPEHIKLLETVSNE